MCGVRDATLPRYNDRAMVKWIFRTLLFVVGVLVGVQVGVRLLIRVKPVATPPQFAPMLNNRLRLRYRDPVKAVDFINLHRNEIVLEVGAGTGVFTLEAAKRVGEGGLVHAVDIQPRMIERLADQLDTERVRNVKLHVAPATRLPLPNNSVDAAFMISTLPMIAERRTVLAELKRVLKPGGELVIGEEMPEPEYVRPVSIRKWAEQAGFRMIGKNGNAWAYLLKFVKPLPIVEQAEEIASAA